MGQRRDSGTAVFIDRKTEADNSFQAFSISAAILDCPHHLKFWSLPQLLLLGKRVTTSMQGRGKGGSFNITPDPQPQWIPWVWKLYTLLTSQVPERKKASPETQRGYQPVFEQNGTKYLWSHSEIHCLKMVHLKCSANRRNHGAE